MRDIIRSIDGRCRFVGIAKKHPLVVSRLVSLDFTQFRTQIAKISVKYRCFLVERYLFDNLGVRVCQIIRSIDGRYWFVGIAKKYPFVVSRPGSVYFMQIRTQIAMISVKHRCFLVEKYLFCNLGVRVCKILFEALIVHAASLDFRRSSGLNWVLRGLEGILG